MSNMSYCRFRNTKQDLEECVDTLEEMMEEEEQPAEALSVEELQAMKAMYDLCQTYIAMVEKVYILTFDELSDEAKAKALENLADINVDHEWWDFTADEIERLGGKLESFEVGYHRHCHITSNDWGAFSASIVENHGEQTDTYKTAKLFLDNKIDEEDFVQAIREDYTILLNNEYDYLVSDKAIIETIESNGYEFCVDGSLYQLTDSNITVTKTWEVSYGKQKSRSQENPEASRYP